MGTLDKVASFDVFDTTLTRLVGAPQSLFLLLGRQLRSQSLVGCSADEFMTMRVQAERHARRQIRSREVTLEEIYDVVGGWLDLPIDQKQQMIDMEYALEEELIRPVPGSHDRIRRARETASRVLYVSDTYVPAPFVEAQLARHGFWTSSDKCYVSNEFRKTKQTGELFHEIMCRESLSPDQIEHWGDNPVSDVRGAKRAGITATHFSQGNLNRFEKILESFASETQGLSSLLAGASRLARLELSDTNTHNQSLAVVAAGVAAPVLTAYVLWALFRARDLGVKRIYFVSRDGEILLEIARELTCALGIEIECRYLYGSRQAWHLPAIDGEIDESDLKWILEPTRFLSVRTALRRVELRPEEVERELTSVGLESTTWDRDLSEAERARLRDALLSPSVESRVLEKAKQARSTATDYLRQEGLFDSVRMAIVDLGWRGRAMRSLSKIVANSGGKLPTPFFFGLVDGAESSTLGQRETYLFDADRQLGYDTNQLPSRFVNLLEVFCSGYEGAATGYTRTNDDVRVNLQSASNEQVIDWGLPILRETVANFTSYVVQGLAYTELRSDMRPVVRALLSEFWERPTKSETMAWGLFPYEDDQTASHRERLTMPISWSSVVLALYDRDKWKRNRPIWMAGSLATSPIPVRLFFKSVMRLRQVWFSLRRSVRARHSRAGRFSKR